MYSHKPIFISKYLTWKKSIPRRDIKHLFYLSWEDALWDLLPKLGISKGSTILTPTWYCHDVENNIINHGYQVRHYLVNNNLQPTKDALTKAIKHHEPAMVILHHPLGITNQVITDYQFMTQIFKKCIVIEDSVHRIINPSKVNIFSSNHLIIDSLRKTIPLQGSNVFGLKSSLNFNEPSLAQSWYYRLKVTLLWQWMNFWWIISTLINSIYAAEHAQKIMQTGYDLIGDSLLPARGNRLFGYLFKYIDFKKLQKIKVEQIKIYEHYFKTISTNTLSPISYPILDRKQLLGYPLKVKKSSAKRLLSLIKKNGLLLRYELADNNWDQNYQILCLPTGPYLTHKNIVKIAQIVIQSLKRLPTRAPHAGNAR